MKLTSYWKPAAAAEVVALPTACGWALTGPSAFRLSSSPSIRTVGGGLASCSSAWTSRASSVSPPDRAEGSMSSRLLHVELHTCQTHTRELCTSIIPVYNLISRILIASRAAAWCAGMRAHREYDLSTSSLPHVPHMSHVMLQTHLLLVQHE